VSAFDVKTFQAPAALSGQPLVLVDLSPQTKRSPWHHTWDLWRGRLIRLPDLVTIIGSTEAEAKRREKELWELLAINDQRVDMLGKNGKLLQSNTYQL
jgi:hypothetical protein